jgi:hypothetical protein
MELQPLPEVNLLGFVLRREGASLGISTSKASAKLEAQDRFLTEDVCIAPSFKKGGS